MIMQWNVRGLNARKNELRKFLENNVDRPDIICVQETFLKPNKPFVLDGYTVVRKDRLDAFAGGVATLIRNDLNFVAFDNLPENVECIGVEIILKNTRVTVINVYNPPNKEILYEEYMKLFKQKNCIITGDFNAKCKSWGSDTTDKTGQTLENLMADYNYIIINDGQPTYQKHTGGMSVLDITLVSSSLATACSRSTLDNTMGSDHVPTFTMVNGVEKFECGTAPKWKLHTAKWDKYRDLCNTRFAVEMMDDDIDVMNAVITENIVLSAGQSIGKTSGNANRKYKPLPY